MNDSNSSRESSGLLKNSNLFFSSPREREKELNVLLVSFYEQGFLAASFDSMKVDSFTLTAFLNTGPSYEWAALRTGNADPEIIIRTGFNEKFFKNKPFKPGEISRLLENILLYCENHGYPFALVKLDSIEISGKKNNMISASLNLTKNKLFLIDSVMVNGNARISEKFLYNHISIKPTDIYNESLVKNISIRLKELPFMSEKEPSRILFTEKQAKLLLFVKDKKASSINGVLGILQDAYETEKTLLVGEARMKLINSLGKGELLDINWRKMQSGTNDLKLAFNYPFLLNTPFGMDINFKLYKRDSTFIDINQVYGVQYSLAGGKNFKAFAGRQTSNLISTKGYEKITVLPNFADISVTSYGIGFIIEKLDYRLNPRKGIFLDITGSAGTKQIRKNARINPAVYDSLALKSVQYNTSLDFDAFIPFFKKSTLNIGIKGAYLINNTLFQNELFRIGGMHTLRGFDEESINASLYSVLTLEYRYLLEQNSYFHVFFDGAYYENKSLYFQGSRYDRPFGFGSGVSFETKAGIFALSYALGKQFDNPILIKTGKVHFGFMNYF